MHEKEGLAGMSSKRRWSFGRWEIFSASIINITPHRRLQRREQQFHGNIHAPVVLDDISGDYRPKS